MVLVGFAFGLQKCSCKLFEVILCIQTKLCEFMSLSAEGLAEIPQVSFASLFQHFVLKQTWEHWQLHIECKKKHQRIAGEAILQISIKVFLKN